MRHVNPFLCQIDQRSAQVVTTTQHSECPDFRGNPSDQIRQVRREGVRMHEVLKRTRFDNPPIFRKRLFGTIGQIIAMRLSKDSNFLIESFAIHKLFFKSANSDFQCFE